MERLFGIVARRMNIMSTSDSVDGYMPLRLSRIHEKCRQHERIWDIIESLIPKKVTMQEEYCMVTFLFDIIF